MQRYLIMDFYIYLILLTICWIVLYFASGSTVNKEESPRMGTEFGCKICMLCADCLQSSVSFHIVCTCVFASFDSKVFWLLAVSTLITALRFCLLCSTKEIEFCLSRASSDFLD